MKPLPKQPRPRKYTPSDFDYLFMGFLAIMAVIMCVSTCNGQTSCDSLNKQNTQLRSAIKALPIEEILDLFATYDRMLHDCEATKEQISQAATKTLNANVEQLRHVEQLLSMSSNEVEQLRNELLNTKSQLTDIRKSTKKARRQIFFERLGTVILSSAATIVIINIAK